MMRLAIFLKKSGFAKIHRIVHPHHHGGLNHKEPTARCHQSSAKRPHRDDALGDFSVKNQVLQKSIELFIHIITAGSTTRTRTPGATKAAPRDPTVMMRLAKKVEKFNFQAIQKKILEQRANNNKPSPRARDAKTMVLSS